MVSGQVNSAFQVDGRDPTPPPVPPPRAPPRSDPFRSGRQMATGGGQNNRGQNNRGPSKAQRNAEQKAVSSMKTRGSSNGGNTKSRLGDVSESSIAIVVFCHEYLFETGSELK